MPKMKTHRGAAKRLKKTGTGKLKRMRAYKSHILTKKTQKRKRRTYNASDFWLGRLPWMTVGDPRLGTKRALGK